MKKRLMAIVIAVFVMAAVTGCAKVTKLSDKDNDMVAEYIVGCILKHSNNYSDSIDYDRDILTATPTPAPTSAPTNEPQDGSDKPKNDSSSVSDGSKDDTSPVKVSLSDLLGNNSIKITQTSYKMGKSYGSDYSSISARSGNKLLVVYFNIKNISSKSAKINLAKKDVSYQLVKNDKLYGKPLLTIAQGDMQYYNMRIPAGENKQGILIFEVKSSFKAKGAVIEALAGDKEADITIK